jgi:hypothetical protein
MMASTPHAVQADLRAAPQDAVAPAYRMPAFSVIRSMIPLRSRSARPSIKKI